MTPASTLALQDKIILITGAADGIGQAVALAYAAQGATLILLDRSIPKLERLYDTIVQAGWPQPALYPLDLEGAKASDYADLATILTENFGQLHGLVHNAAVLGTLTPIEHYNPALWQAVMQVNVNAPFLLTRACLPLLTRSAPSSLIFTLDQHNTPSWAYWGAYSASKFALNGLFVTLSAELGHSGVRVNAINPGKVNTFLRRSAYPGINPQTWAQPETITAAYLYLMSAASEAVRGMVLEAQGSLRFTDTRAVSIQQ